MNSTLKTTLIIFFVLTITFTLLFFYVNAFGSVVKKDRTDLENKFYSQLDHDKKKVFLVGSSHVARLNETYIQEYLFKNNKDYEVYNLASPAETPKERLPFIDAMIAAKPDIVVYGVGYRDFLDAVSEFDATKPPTILPDPSQDFKYGMISFERFLNYDFDNFRSPQLVFRYLVRDHFDFNKKPDNQISIYTKTRPFFAFHGSEGIILNDTQLQKIEEGVTFKFNTMVPYDKSESIYSFKQIITKLKENNIKVIVFSTPHTKYYTDKVPPEIRNQFDLTLQKISQEEEVPVYLLRDKYVDLPIWNDNHHIAANPKALIFSQDIAKIILNETRP